MENNTADILDINVKLDKDDGEFKIRSTFNAGFRSFLRTNKEARDYLLEIFMDALTKSIDE